MIYVNVVKIQYSPPVLHTETTTVKEHVPLSFVAIQTQKYDENFFFVVFSSVLGIRDVNSITSPNSFAVPILITRYNVGLVSSTQSRSLIYTRLTICGLPTDYRKYSKTCFHY